MGQNKLNKHSLGSKKILELNVAFSNKLTLFCLIFFQDGVMIQMVQNYLDFFANTLFWLSYIPFYERLFPVFDVNRTDQGSGRDRTDFGIRFRLPETGFGFRSRSVKSDEEKEFEITIRRFSNLLRAFSGAFGTLKK